MSEVDHGPASVLICSPLQTSLLDASLRSLLPLQKKSGVYTKERKGVAPLVWTEGLGEHVH